MSKKKMSLRDQLKRTFSTKGRFFPYVFYQKLILLFSMLIPVFIGLYFSNLGNTLPLILSSILMFSVIIYLLVVVSIEDKERRQEREQLKENMGE